MIGQSIRMAFAAIFANKMRALLTMLGIIIGVMSLVVLVSLVTSATNSVSQQISAIGKDRLSVSVMDDKGKPLKPEDLKVLGQQPFISMVAPVIQAGGQVKKGSNSISVSIIGTNNAYFTIDGNKLDSGRLILTPDVDNVSYVTVLSYEAAQEIFGRTTDVVGQVITLDSRKYEVVGVLQKDTSLMAGFMGRYTIYVPYSIATRLYAYSTGITSFYATATNSGTVDIAQAYLSSALKARFNGDSQAYYIMNMNTMANTMSSVTSTFALLLGGIAAISLLVGGIGIMNIMLVSVTERTREIGIRKAIGARRGNIMLQFLIESLVICLMGCAIGIAISGVILMIVNSIAGSLMTFTFSGGVLIVAILFSTFIGLVFGLYPAQKAARMNPIDALRYE